VKRFDPAEIAFFERYIRHMVLAPDPSAFRQVLVESSAIPADTPATDQELFEAMTPFYELVLEDRVVTWTPEHATRVVRNLFDRSSPVTRNTSGGGAMFVFIQRINLGLYGLFGRLGATANWRRIAEELWPIVDAPPSTHLGREEAAWWATRDEAAATAGEVASDDRGPETSQVRTPARSSAGTAPHGSPETSPPSSTSTTTSWC
jgi:hypothetical protein